MGLLLNLDTGLQGPHFKSVECSGHGHSSTFFVHPSFWDPSTKEEIVVGKVWESGPLDSWFFTGKDLVRRDPWFLPRDWTL